MNSGSPVEPLNYSAEVESIRTLVNQRVPLGATIAVVSKGDPNLVQFSGRVGWHFPRNEHGIWAGYHPADSNAAIACLEEIRAAGARYFLLPQSFSWWLNHYGAFKRYLEESYRLIASGNYGWLYELSATKDNKLNQISTRVDYLLGVLHPLLEQVRHNAQQPPPVPLEEQTAERAELAQLAQLTETITHRLNDIEQAFNERDDANAAEIAEGLQQVHTLTEQLAAVAQAVPELHEKLQAISSIDPVAGLEQKLREQEEFLTAQFERRLVQQRNEHERHLQDQHVVMLRLLEDQQRLFMLNLREMDDKLTARFREKISTFDPFTQKLEQTDLKLGELREALDNKVVDLEALVESLKLRLEGEATRIAEAESRTAARLEKMEKHMEAAAIPSAAEPDETGSHQRRFNLSMMQAMDSIAAHLRAVDARLNLLNHHTSAVHANVKQTPDPGEA